MTDHPTISVCLTIHNQEPIVERVMRGIYDNASPLVNEFIVVFDGCKDRTEEIARKTASEYKLNTAFYETDDIWETRANNFSFSKASGDYIITVQDDMQITEPLFDRRLLKPFTHFTNLLGVTARNAQNEVIINGEMRCTDVAGKDAGTPRNIFSIKRVIVRGPIMFNHRKLKDCGYLDEVFSPLDGDDKDLSFRAFKKFGYVVGAYNTEYISPLQWGKTRNNPISNQIWAKSAEKNIKLLMERHGDLMQGQPYGKDYVIE